MDRGPSELMVFDAETTGTDKRRDQIIELCVQFGLDADSPHRVWRFRPDVPISPGAQAVHGISMDDVADCPRFRDLADEIRSCFEAVPVWVGYNLSFDIEMLQSEFRRLEQAPLNVQDKTIIDAFRLWQRSEPRTLMDAHRRFAGEEFESAHSALADVSATGRVLKGMLKQFDIGGSWHDVAAVCEPERRSWVGPSRHVRWNDSGEPVIGFGRHAGTALADLAAGPDAGYLAWILKQDFPDHVQTLCRWALEMDRAQLLSRAQETYGPSPLADRTAVSLSA